MPPPERIHHVDQRSVGLHVGEDLGDAPVEGVGEIQVIVDGRVAAGEVGHVGGAGVTARNMSRQTVVHERLSGVECW